MGFWGTVKKYGTPIVSPAYALGGFKGLAGTAMIGAGALTGNPGLIAAGVGTGYSGFQDKQAKRRPSPMASANTGLARAQLQRQLPTKKGGDFSGNMPSPSPLTVPMPDGSGNYGGYGSVANSIKSGGAYADPNQEHLKMYSTPSPEEVRHAGNVDNLARLIGEQGGSLYNISNPTYASALKYYGDILGGSKAATAAAIAPEAEMLAEMNAAEQKSIEQGGLRGGARDTALAEASRAGAGAISSLVPKARQVAAAAGSQLALQGMGLGTEQQGRSAGLYDQLRGAAQQNRQFGIQAEMQNRWQAAGIDVQQAQLALQEKLGMRGLDLEQMALAVNEKLQSRGLDLQQFLGMSGLQLQRELGLAGINLSQQQIDLMKQQMKEEAARGKGQMIGDIGGMIIQTLPMILPSGGGGSSSVIGTSGTGGKGFGGLTPNKFAPQMSRLG